MGRRPTFRSPPDRPGAKTGPEPGGRSSSAAPTSVRESTPALAADLARLLREAGLNAGLFYLLPGANAFGAALLSPGGESPTPLVEALEAGAVKALLVVENDPFWDYPDRERLVRALDKLELLVALDYLPSPTVQRADIVFPTLTLFERSPSSFVNQEGRLQLAPPVHLGGAPLAQISPEGHPPRTFLSHVPGGEPRTPAEILQELAAALPQPVTLPGDDLWDWLSRENPVFANIATLFEPPPGARLLPEASPARVFPRPRRWPQWPRPPDHLELLLVDLTFGTEELASYSKHIQQVEETPRLLMHPEDAARLGLSAGDRVALRLPGGTLEVDLQVAENMAPGVLVLPRHRQLNWRLTPDYQVLVSYRRYRQGGSIMSAWTVGIVLLLIKLLVVLVVLLLLAAYLVYVERRLLGFMQLRLGPNRAGPQGLLQPIADAVKLLTKEDFIPAGADRVIFLYAPALVAGTALLIFAVIPFARAGPSRARRFPGWSAISTSACSSSWPCRPSGSTGWPWGAGPPTPSLPCWGPSGARPR